MFLVDANLLIALGDPTHVHHRRSRSWFLSPGREAWATCPLTENAFVRILGHPNYPGFDGGTMEARAILKALTSAPGHQFWPATLSLRDEGALPELGTSKHLTDLYLLALAVSSRAKFATLDERIDAELVPGGRDGYFVVPRTPE